mgnify:CR=1 FL=1
MKKQKKHTGLIITLSIAAAMAIGVVVYSHFGGFGTGECADTEEFSKYAVDVSDITIPEQAQIRCPGRSDPRKQGISAAETRRVPGAGGKIRRARFCAGG